MLRRIRYPWNASLLAIFLNALSFAQTAAEWDSPRINAIAQKLRCGCGCRLTMSCQMPPHPCPACKRNKIRIYKMLAEGRSEREIVERFVAEEGPDALWVTPGAAGRTGPYAALGLGFVGVVLVIRRYRRNDIARTS